MKLFIVIFLIFSLVMLGMAVGVILGRKPIKGSCGGLGAIGIERACGCKDVCEKELIEETVNDSSVANIGYYHPRKTNKDD